MKNLKYNLTINNTSEIIENVNMSDLIQHISKALENNNYPVELFKINYIPSADLEYVEKEIK